MATKLITDHFSTDTPLRLVGSKCKGNQRSPQEGLGSPDLKTSRTNLDDVSKQCGDEEMSEINPPDESLENMGEKIVNEVDSTAESSDYDEDDVEKTVV